MLPGARASLSVVAIWLIRVVDLTQPICYTPLEDFVLPGGTQVSSFLHQASCVCRRAESLLVELAQQEPIGEFVLQYINRLSDALFVLARYQNHAEGLPDLIWRKADKRE